MKSYGIVFFLVLLPWLGRTAPRHGNDAEQIVVGAEQLDAYLPLLKGKRVAVTANQSALIGGKRDLDTLLALGVNVIKAFGPEHGLLGKTSANTYVANQLDETTGIPVVSLFGDHVKPTPSDMDGVELMLFDMQDVGVRFYTYISTLHYVMEACAAHHIPLVVLDRPNPNDGYVDGPVLEKGFASFIGMHPVPIVHGMTIGEYAQMINGQHWLKNGIQCPLTVIRMQHYYHGKPYILPVPPSPNLNTQQAIYLYPSLCWFGATAISDGRGTYFPFQLLGSPKMKGVFDFSFTPHAIKGMSEKPMYEGETCYGIDLRAYDIRIFQQKKQLNLQWLLDWYQCYPDKAHFFNGEQASHPDKPLHFDYLAGNGMLRQQIKAGKSEKEIRASWQPALTAYRKMRKAYLLYP